MPNRLNRRTFLELAAAASPFALRSAAWAAPPAEAPLAEFGYEQVRVTGGLQAAQRDNVTSVLMGLDEDSLLKPFRAMAGKPAPGVSLGGWYEWLPDYDFHHGEAGLAPASTFGQWTSALSRLYAASRFATPAPPLQARVLRLHALLAEAISPAYFAQTRFAGYSLDKLVCGLIDAHQFAADPAALTTLDQVATAAEPSLPGHAVDRETQWKLGADISWMWDETYTLPENLYLAAQRGAGPRYSRMAQAYLDDKSWFEPLSRGVNVLADHHAYSYVNSLNSAMQAYLTGGSEMHLRAAQNGFDFLAEQSFATGGWGPDEALRKPGSPDLAKSLAASHNAFETPCGSYAHMKLTRYLLRATRDGRYGDSMERILHNTILGVLPLEPDGRSFYNSDYNFMAQRVYSVHRWPCCSGTLPQVVADYGINTYLQAPGEIWINLYQPSQLHAAVSGQPVSLTQNSTYPDDETIHLSISPARPTAFTLRLRIPAWAGSGAGLLVNGTSTPISISRGFTAINRTWRTGDSLALTLPMPLRLEPLPANGGPPQTSTVAVMRGPTVLFPIRTLNESGPLTLARDALLNAKQTGPREWTIATPAGTRVMVPFPEIGDRLYSTYVQLG